jgi:Family of unknown function (DUF5675)
VVLLGGLLNILWEENNMLIVLLRDTFTVTETLGKYDLRFFPEFSCDVLEQPRNHDIPDHSCIPTGTYQMVPHVSAHLHEDDGVTPLQTWAFVNPLLGVFHNPGDEVGYSGTYPVRTDCLVHPANFAAQLEGCQAPGDSRKQVNGSWMVTNSRITFKKLRSLLGGAGTIGNSLMIQELG